jgi:hypothetical protein
MLLCSFQGFGNGEGMRNFFVSVFATTTRRATSTLTLHRRQGRGGRQTYPVINTVPTAIMDKGVKEWKLVSRDLGGGRRAEMQRQRNSRQKGWERDSGEAKAYAAKIYIHSRHCLFSVALRESILPVRPSSISLDRSLPRGVWPPGETGTGSSKAR